MTTTTFLELQNRVLGQLGTSETADRNLVKDYINESSRDIWRSFPWHERKTTAWASCLAPYTTGTVTTTKASAAVTGSGTVFPAASATRPYKFASGYGEPWFEVSARGGDTSLTLDRVWNKTALSGSSYVLYDDRVLLAADCEVLLTDQVWITDTSSPQMFRMHHAVEAEQPWPTGSGIPWWFVLTDNYTGTDGITYKRLRLGPVTPDDIYAVHYAYLKTWTDLSGDSDVPALNEALMDLVVMGALSRAYMEEPWRDTDLAERAEMAYGRLLNKEIQRARSEYPNTVRLRTFDQRPSDGTTFSWILPSTS